MTSTTPKILLAFVAGVAIAAGGFWVATHRTANTAIAPASVDQDGPKPVQLPAALKPIEPPASASGPETPVAMAKAPPVRSSRPSALATAGQSPNTAPVQNQPASSGLPPQDATVASAAPLPDLIPGQAAPPSSPQPGPVTNGSPDVQPKSTSEQVFRPEDQPQSAPRQPRTVTIDAGTSLVVRLAEALSTEKNVTGDTFRGTLDSPIILDGFIIADKGSQVHGKVANSQKAGRVDGLSSIALTLTEINTTDGQTVRVKTNNWEKLGEKSVGTDAAKIGGGAVLGAIIGAIAGGGKGAAIGAAGGGAVGTGVVLATRGKPTVLPLETRLTFRLDQPVSITERINN